MVIIPDEKFEYLKAQKSGSMKRLGLLDKNPADLQAMLEVKISKDHLYNLSFSP